MVISSYDLIRAGGTHFPVRPFFVRPLSDHNPGRNDIIGDVLKSAPWRSLTCCVLYLGIVVLIATAASSQGLCGDGDLRKPPCSWFAFGVAIYGAIAICSITTLAVVVGVVLKRRVSPLLKISAVLYAIAVLSLVLPVRAASSKLAGAIVVMAVLPISVVLLAAALMSVAMWAGRAWAQSSGDTVAIVSQRSSSN
jgi:hypothetical protein